MGCPLIKEMFSKDESNTLMPIIVEKCKDIASELVLARVNDDASYLGTPDDQRMVREFGEYFGNIHIGTGDVTSGNRVTDLEFIRWRTTLYGARGQVELDAKKRLADEAKTRSRGTTNAQSRAQPGEPNDHNMIAGEARSIGAAARKGKKCSNFECPAKSRYDKALSLAWSKCKSSCIQCEGAIHVCPNADCKAFLATHKALHGVI